MSLVTIILTTLNSERYLARSIESCLGQTHHNLELLIVDGGSTDRTLTIVEHYDDPRIRLIHQEGNAGRLPGAINLGMADSRGEFITWTQDDCWYEPNAIEAMLGFLIDHAKVDLVYADYWDVDEGGERTRYQAVPEPEQILSGDVIRVCFLFRRRVYETIGPQDVRYFPVHEVPWRIRVASRFNIEPMHVPLMHYTVQPASLTGQIGGWQLQRMTALSLYELGYLNRRAYRFRRAEIAINQAFEAFVLRGDYRTFRRQAVVGLVQDRRWMRNRGLWKMALLSLVPARDSYRRKLHTLWLEGDARRQRRLIKGDGVAPRAPSREGPAWK